MIFADQRFALDDPVGRKILKRPDAAVRTHAVDQLRGNPACIKALGALIGDGLEGIRQIRLLDEGAQLGNRAVGGQESPRRIRRTQQNLPLVANGSLQARIQRKALARQANRRLQASLQGQLAVLARQVLECGRLARNRGRQCPVNRRILDLVAGLVQVHVARRGARRLLPCIEHGFVAVGLPMQQSRTRRRPDPSWWVRPRRAPRTPPPPHRRHCRPPREFPAPPGSPGDRRWRWPPCAQRPCAPQRPTRMRGAAAARSASAREWRRSRRSDATAVRNGRARRGADDGSIKACGAVSVRSRRWDARTPTHCRPAPRFRAPESRK